MHARRFEDITAGDEIAPWRLAMDYAMVDAYEDLEFGGLLPSFIHFRGHTFAPGHLRMAQLVQYIFAWAGPEAMVRQVLVAFRRPDTVETPLTAYGHVGDLRVEGGRGIVIISVSLRDDHDEAVIDATVTLWMPLRAEPDVAPPVE